MLVADNCAVTLMQISVRGIKKCQLTFEGRNFRYRQSEGSEVICTNKVFKNFKIPKFVVKKQNSQAFILNSGFVNFWLAQNTLHRALNKLCCPLRDYHSVVKTLKRNSILWSYLLNKKSMVFVEPWFLFWLKMCDCFSVLHQLLQTTLSPNLKKNKYGEVTGEYC